MPENIDANLNFRVLGDKELQRLITLLAKSQEGAQLTAKELSQMEKSLVKVGLSAKEAVAGLKAQKTASDQLSGSLRNLNAQNAAVNKIAKGTGAGFAATPEMAARISLINQQSKALGEAAAAEQKFRDAQKASNARVKNIEDKDLLTTKRAVTKEIQADAAERARIEDANYRRNKYISESNVRQAKLEAADLATTRKAVTKEMEADAKKRQQVAFQSYANNAPGAIKQAQRAAYDTYASNIAYSKAIVDVNNGLSNQRYALYDVASTLAVVTAATLGTVTAVETLGISFEKNFASVQRTSGAMGDDLESLRQQLLGISTTIPVAFGDVTQIATLGGQLGIASENIGEFTKVVTEFGSTTDVTMQKAAEGFGRLGQLTGVPASDFNKLGSAIYQVGITSVATESQVLAVAQQIAVAGNLAGMSADEVVALAGSLASLGVQPEAARGSIARIFNIITKAADEGGASLDQFAKISGISADQFASQWKDDASGTFKAFIDGLEGAANSGQSLSTILSDLGLRAVRDQNALKLLAANTEVYTKALKTSADAYGAGTALASGYQVVADTLAAKLQVLAQTLQAIAAEAAKLGIVKEVVGLFQSLANSILDFVQTPVGGIITGIVLAFGALIGVISAVIAAQALTTASAYALRTAMGSMGKESGLVLGGFKALTQQLLMLAIGEERAALGAAKFKSEMAGGAGRVTAFGSAMNAAGISARGLATGLAAIGKASVIGLAITVAFAGIAKAIDTINSHFDTAEEKANKFFGDLSGLTDAMQKDTTAGGESFRKISTEVTKTSEALAPWAQDLQTATGAQVELNNATKDTSTSVQDQTVLVGANAKAWLANALANNQAFQQYYQKNATALKQAGFDLKTFLNATLASDGGGVAYLQSLTDNIAKVDVAAQRAGGANIEFGGSVGVLSAGAQDATDRINGLVKVAEASDGAFQSAADKAEFTSSVFSALGVNADIGAGGVDDIAATLDDMIGASTDAANALLGVNNAVYSLGQSLAENGNSFDAFSVAGRNNLGALQSTISAMVTAAGGDSAALAVMLQGLMNSLASYGVNAVKELAYVQAAIASLTGGKGVTNLAAVNAAAGASGVLLAQGMNKGAKAVRSAGGAARSAAKDVHTLTDYVSDLTKVFRASYDIRFGLQTSLDKVADAYQKLSDYSNDAKESVADAAQALRQADADIRGLKAANTTLSYQLTVAQEYGDLLRANEIMADMAKNNSDIADKQKDQSKSAKDLSKAQAALGKSLKGGTAESREQRGMILDLVEAYQAQVAALANSGLSQQELARRTSALKTEFIAQATALGYSKKEIVGYAASFDDLTYAIKNVPRKITVNADMNPAKRALAEFLAQVKSSKANVGGGLATPTANTTYAQGVAAGDAYAKGWNAAVGKQRKLLIQKDNGVPGGKRYSVDGGHTWFLQKGGQVGSGVQYHSTGGVHGLGFEPRGTDTTPAMLTPGEFVLRKEAVNRVGLPFMNALNNMQTPKYLALGSGTGGGGSSMSLGPQLVELMPTQMMQLASILSTTLRIDGKMVAEATNTNNAVSARRGSN